MREIDHQMQTAGEEFFSCHTGETDDRPPYVMIGNEEIAVTELLDIVDHIRTCPLVALRSLPRLKPTEPTYRIDRIVFNELHEYSSSFPTGTFIGKRWRRRYKDTAGVEHWLLCEYGEHPTDPKRVTIRQWTPVFEAAT